MFLEPFLHGQVNNINQLICTLSQAKAHSYATRLLWVSFIPIFFCWWLHHIKGGKSSDMIYLGVIYFPMQQPLFLFYFSLSLFLSLLFVQPHEKRSENSRGILWTIHHNINTRNTCMVLSYIHSTFILQSLKLPPAMIISVVFVHTCLYMLKLQIPFSFF